MRCAYLQWLILPLFSLTLPLEKTCSQFGLPLSIPSPRNSPCSVLYKSQRRSASTSLSCIMPAVYFERAHPSSVSRWDRSQPFFKRLWNRLSSYQPDFTASTSTIIIQVAAFVALAFFTLFLALLIASVGLCCSSTVFIIGHAVLRRSHNHLLEGVPLLWSFKVGLVGNTITSVAVSLVLLLATIVMPPAVQILRYLLVSAFVPIAGAIGAIILDSTKELVEGAVVAGCLGSAVLVAAALAVFMLGALITLLFPCLSRN